MRRQIAFLVLLPAALAGCMQMSYVVRLDEDGSGKVTEVVEFGPKGVRLEKKLPKGEGKRLVATLRGGELDEKYEMLLSAYFLELARQGK